MKIDACLYGLRTAEIHNTDVNIAKGSVQEQGEPGFIRTLKKKRSYRTVILKKVKTFQKQQ
jgi:hypothetical protein